MNMLDYLGIKNYTRQNSIEEPFMLWKLMIRSLTKNKQFTDDELEKCFSSGLSALDFVERSEGINSIDDKYLKDITTRRKFRYGNANS